MNGNYETIIGLEVHVQLNTESKIFCADSTYYGAAPNTLVSAISLAHPGTLPKLNEAVIPKAVRLGLALDATINPRSTFDRKAYFYPDLPKGYQITQEKNPVLIGGKIELSDGHTIRIHHVHLEEDAGKSIHHLDPSKTLLDYNRAGTPLLEIVTEPDFRSGEQVEEFLHCLRQLIRYLDISDGNMEQGSMRCDVNISIREKGKEEYNARCEVKNVNSMKFAKQAIKYESNRQANIMEIGGVVSQNTLNFNPDTGITTPQRSKENAEGYQYFPEPDLPPILISEDYIKSIQENMPTLPWELERKIQEVYKISTADTKLIVAEKEVANYFMDYSSTFPHVKAFANLLIHQLIPFCKEKKMPIHELALKKPNIAELLTMVAENKISASAAKQTLLPDMIFNPDIKPQTLAEKLGLLQSNDNDELSVWIDQVIQENPDKVDAYKSGKKGLIGFFMGEIMKKSQGKANPKKTNKLLAEKLDA